MGCAIVDKNPLEPCLCVCCTITGFPLLYHAKLAAEQQARPMISGFPVGAAFLMKNGDIVTAANVENITLNLSQCAERNGVMRLVQDGLAEGVVAIAVYSPQSDSLSPCGSCRQLMAEYLSPDVKVFFLWKGRVVYATIDELLPYVPQVDIGER